jgi:hypothetical protein
LLLISSDFMASKYCWNKEVEVALERHRAGTARVIPVILRSVSWHEDTPLGNLQALPTGAKPVTLWSDEDEALTDVGQGIRKVVETLRTVLRREVHRVPNLKSQHFASTQLYYTFSPWGWIGELGIGFGLHYQLPKGADPRLTSVEDAPISLVFTQIGRCRILLHKKYVGNTPVGRPGNYFIHALIDPKVVSEQTGAYEPISACTAISLWESPFWKTSEDQVTDRGTDLPSLTPEELSHYTGMQPDFSSPDWPKVVDWLPQVFSAFLMLKKLNKRHLYIAAPSEMVAAFIWFITRCLPRTLSIVQELTFSTYERDITNAPMVIVGTCWLPLGNDYGSLVSQDDHPASCYQEQPDNLALAINCFNRKQTPFEIDELVHRFTKFAISSLVEKKMKNLDTILRQAEEKNYQSLDDLLTLFHLQREEPTEAPTKELVQDLIARPEFWSNLLNPTIHKRLLDLSKDQAQDPNWQRWWQTIGKIQLQQMRQCVLEQPESEEAAALSALADEVIHEEAEAHKDTMASPQTTSIPDRSRWIICLCHRVWKTWIVVWGTLVGILCSVFGTLLLYRWPWSSNAQLAQSRSPVSWAVQHPLILLLCGLGLLLLVIILYLVSRLPCHEEDETTHTAQKPSRIVEASGDNSLANDGTMIGNTIVFGDYTRGADSKEGR